MDGLRCHSIGNRRFGTGDYRTNHAGRIGCHLVGGDDRWLAGQFASLGWNRQHSLFRRGDLMLQHRIVAGRLLDLQHAVVPRGDSGHRIRGGKQLAARVHPGAQTTNLDHCRMQHRCAGRFIAGSLRSDRLELRLDLVFPNTSLPFSFRCPAIRGLFGNVAFVW